MISYEESFKESCKESYEKPYVKQLVELSNRRLLLSHFSSLNDKFFRY